MKHSRKVDNIIKQKKDDSFKNFIEENFCYRNLQAQQDAFIYYTLGSLGVLIVSIALNKISVYTREKVKIFNNFF